MASGWLFNGLDSWIIFLLRVLGSNRVIHGSGLWDSCARMLRELRLRVFRADRASRMQSAQ